MHIQSVCVCHPPHQIVNEKGESCESDIELHTLKHNGKLFPFKNSSSCNDNECEELSFARLIGSWFYCFGFPSFVPYLFNYEILV